ncbi:hypothetical protein B0T24DRAFT_673350 [Lasiosphaeria ovina]|uniref:Uncharacterized protein n=1 Tax=Lasiosphaeria ovina TaxID=92902 RepID=A0AAE0NLB8_9PEZI|nr:hypothetical protein B0T24DRAFT_673350 [Lasiosphaeria ovina]
MGYFRSGNYGDHHELKSATRGGKMGGIHDETSIERAFNAATAFEMGGTDRHHNKTSANTTVFADPDALSSDESLSRQHPIDHVNNGRKGITKTMTTTVD